MQTIKEIAKQVESDFQCGGLSDGLYFDFAQEVTARYILEAGKVLVSESDLRNLDRTTKVLIDLLEPIDQGKARELYQHYDST